MDAGGAEFLALALLIAFQPQTSMIYKTSCPGAEPERQMAEALSGVLFDQDRALTKVFGGT